MRIVITGATGLIGKALCRQQVSWITIGDEIAAIRFLIENEGLSGIFNLTAPNPVSMRELCLAVGRIMNRPCRLPIPGLVLKVALGKMADETLLADQRIMPKRMIKAGFKFAFPDIGEALKSLFRRSEK